MAALVTQLIGLPSVLPTFAAATVTTGDTVVAGNDTFVVVKNGGGSPTAVTVVVPGTDEYGNAKPDLAVSVVNGTERYIPLRSAGLIDPTTGLVTVICSPVTSVTIGAFTT